MALKMFDLLKHYRSAPRTVAGLTFAGGCTCVIGDALIRFMLFKVGPPKVYPPSNHLFLLEPGWILTDFFVGLIVVGIIAPFFISRVLTTAEKNGGWPLSGASYGALAGFCASILLAAIHLSILASGTGATEARDGATLVMKLFWIYLPIAVSMFGLPAAVIGAITGIAAEMFLRRYGAGRKGTGVFFVK
jgi:hypothetical protein